VHLATIDPPTNPSPQAPTDDATEVVLKMPAELLRWSSVAVREARRRALEEMLTERA